MFGNFECAAFAAVQDGDQAVDFGAFREAGAGTIGLQPSDQDREISCLARLSADVFDDAQVPVFGDERTEIFECSAQAACRCTHVVQRFTVESARLRAPPPRFERRDALFDELVCPGAELFRTLPLAAITRDALFKPCEAASIFQQTRLFVNPR